MKNLQHLALALAVAAGLGAGSAQATITYDFSGTTLQDWQNRVWDLSANAGSGGWVDLGPNVQTMPSNINGGVIVPAGSGNGLFVNRGGWIGPSGDTDTHLNSLWLESPQFYLDGSGDLTLQLGMGQPHAAAPANDASVPYAAINGGGWMGVALRDTTNGNFVLTVSKSGNGGWASLSLRADQLAALDQSRLYTLDLINIDNGSWGWIAMQNVSIPGSTTPPGPQKRITGFTVPPYGTASISGNNITMRVPHGTAVNPLTPIITVSSGASVSPASGVAQDFTNPVTYTVTASDATTSMYTATVIVLPPGPPVSDTARWFDASQISANNGDPITTWIDNSGNASDATVPSGNAAPTFVANSGTESGLPALYFAKNGGTGNSGALRFTRDGNIRTVFSVFKGASFLLTDNDAFHFHRSEGGGGTDDDPAYGLWGNDTSGNVRDGKTYVNGQLIDPYPCRPLR